MTQEQLFFRSEVNRTYMGAVERGEKTPSLHTIIKIAKGLNISLKELFDY
ncbi:MAG: helix-turn-helix transcriptional regulator [Bacteroidales bacterium]|nr:helix-turn-helix transcriptional regulator [Bacteroidales bacterium]